MAAVRGGQAKPVAPPKPKPKVVPGTRGGAVIPPPPKKKKPPVKTPTTPTTTTTTTTDPGTTAPPPEFHIDWEAALGLDPGLTAANAAADAAIANLNEAFSGANNQYSTVHQLDRSLRQGLRSNADVHAAHHTLFSGGTAQQAANVDRNNQQERYNATQNLNSNVAAQMAAKAAARQQAVGNIIAHPEMYGINFPDPVTAAPAADPGAGAQTQTTTTQAVAPKPFVTQKQLAIDPRAAQKKRNAI